jgi:hypothetical protein
LPSAAFAAPPANDNFANREALTGTLPIEVTGSNVDATKEEGESLESPFANQHSVWFEWEATSTGWITIGSCEDEFPVVVGIFTGSAVDSLTKVANHNDEEGPQCPSEQREYTFKAISGTSYEIAVAGNGFYLPPQEPPLGQGEFTLRVEATPPPPNDDFENATPLEAPITEEPGSQRFYYAHASGYNWGATKQSGEPEHDGNQGGASVWYSWTAPESGTAEVSVCCFFASRIGIYTGNAVDALTPVGGTTGLAIVSVIAGIIYRIAVDGEYDSEETGARMGSFGVGVSMQLPPLAPTEDHPVSSPRSTPFVSPPPPEPTPPDTTVAMKVLKRRPPVFVFTFQSTDPGSLFRCKLDKHPFANCPAREKLGSLRPGRHTLRVAAVDADGSIDPTPVFAHFRVPKTARHSHKHRHHRRR